MQLPLRKGERVPRRRPGGLSLNWQSNIATYLKNHLGSGGALQRFGLNLTGGAMGLLTKVPALNALYPIFDFLSGIPNFEKPDPRIKLEAKWAPKFQQNHRF